MIKKIIKFLAKKDITIAIAESCTGGKLCNEITNFNGSSKIFKLGIIAYSNFAKEKFLKVKTSTLKKYGSISSETAIEMAKNVKNLSKAKVGIAITGIAGKPIERKKRGLIYIAISYENKTICKQFIFKGKRKEIKNKAVKNTFRMLRKYLL